MLRAAIVLVLVLGAVTYWPGGVPGFEGVSATLRSDAAIGGAVTTVSAKVRAVDLNLWGGDDDGPLARAAVAVRRQPHDNSQPGPGVRR